MALILSIETSTPVCSAALHKDGEILTYEELQTPQSAASQLIVQIDSLFLKTGISNQNLDAVAVAKGPGSYTGLRIGIATAKGICFGLGIPLIAIDSLWALAAGARAHSAELLCPMIDARRMEVYCTLLSLNGETVEKTQAMVIDDQSFAQHLSKRSILFFGNGALKCREVITHHHAHFQDNVISSAKHMGKLAHQFYADRHFEDLIQIEPNYLKEFKAKTKMA
jgi:tRNA threonylcarbamoyladenosine biosynthesis protein TsaB